MSTLHTGDAQMHYSDNSHRWIAPSGVEQNVWEAGLRAHLALHRVTLGGPATVEEQREPRPVLIPRQRTPERVAEQAPRPAVTRRTAAAIRQLPRAG
jgi:hypothetical protein